MKNPTVRPFRFLKLLGLSFVGYFVLMTAGILWFCRNDFAHEMRRYYDYPTDGPAVTAEPSHSTPGFSSDEQDVLMRQLIELKTTPATPGEIATFLDTLASEGAYRMQPHYRPSRDIMSVVNPPHQPQPQRVFEIRPGLDGNSLDVYTVPSTVPLR